MPVANASAYTRTQETATKTTASFWRASHATHASSNSRSTTTRDGLAANPQYASKLIQIIELYKLNQYDKAKRYDRFMATHSGTDQPVNAEGLLHPIHIFNKNYYLYAREGDTFKSIGKEVGISWRKLARYNERNKHAVLHKGDIIYLKKKRSKAPKQYKKRPHVIQPGESMYTISQKYGIRLEKLYKMNHLDPNIPVSVGTRLRVR